MKRSPDVKISSSAAFARYVGLARSTVSRVLNGQPGLRQDTIDRVRQAMKEVGFEPNPYARFLLRGRTSTIGVCLRHSQAPAMHEKLVTTQRRLRERGYTALIEMTDSGFTDADDVIRHFMSMRVEGVVLIGGFTAEQVAQVAKLLAPQAIPLVVADQYEYPGVSTVTLDRAGALERLVVELCRLGHRRFGLLGIRLNFIGNDSRVLGIQRGIERCGLSFESAVEVVPVPPAGARSFDFGRSLAETFLSRPPIPTAFLGLNDAVAIGAMWRFQEAGLRVPEDLSITGFNNMEVTQHVSPNLTTVDQCVPTVVSGVVDEILRMIEKPRKRLQRKVIQPEVLLRGSIGPAPAGETPARTPPRRKAQGNG